MQRTLTKKQREVVYDKKGLFAVRACPGSGKTYTVAAKLAHLLSSWPYSNQGIAALSFTNVAWQEIAVYLEEEFGIRTPLGYPHFLGTIDSFINTFLLLPFGHRVMGCSCRPVLTGPPHDTSEPIDTWMWWKNRECKSSLCKLNDFSYDVNGCLQNHAPRNHFNNCKSKHVHCTTLKQRFNELGYATQSDANYFGFKILKDYHHIASALAVRFPVVMVDEAQDTSSVQMKILDTLVENGLSELLLIGDPNQAIYEWRTAEPFLFNDKFAQWGENSVEMAENWRSTQSICNFAYRLSKSDQQMTAADPEMTEFERYPEIWGYSSTEDLPDLFKLFVAECEARDISSNAASVLTRSKQLLNQIAPGAVHKYGLDPWRNDDNLTKGVARSRYLYDTGKFRDAFIVLEREVCKHRLHKSVCRHEDLRSMIEELTFETWRAELYEFLISLPATNVTLSEWISSVNASIKLPSFMSDVQLSIKGDSYKYKHSQLTFEELFANPEDYQDKSLCPLGTVHSVKGKTFEATMLVLKERDGNNRSYINIRNFHIQDDEELRILYVATTRPRKLLIWAVPVNHVPFWKNELGINDAHIKEKMTGTI